MTVDVRDDSHGFGADHPVNAWRVILELGGSSAIVASVEYSRGKAERSSWLSRRSSLGSQQRCLSMNCSLQLKHNPCACLRCVSSLESMQIGVVGVGVVALDGEGSATGGRTMRVNHLCFVN